MNENNKCNFLDEEIDEIMDERMHDLDVVTLFRYSYVSKVPKNLSWYEETFPLYDDKRFRQFVRCSRTQFEVILNAISSHECFNGVNSNKQFTVASQLALVLYRLGSNGDGATIFKIACLFGVGDGITGFFFCLDELPLGRCDNCFLKRANRVQSRSEISSCSFSSGSCAKRANCIFSSDKKRPEA